MSEETVPTEETTEAIEGNEEETTAPATEGKVPLQTRVLGGLIDGLVAGVAGFIVSFILGMISSALGAIGGSAVSAAYMLLRDNVLGNGQSIGKKAMKYQAVGKDGKPCTQEESIKRNLPLAAGSIAGAVIGVLLFVPVLGPLLAGLASLLVAGLNLVIYCAEIYFISSDPKGNRKGDGYAGTTTILLDN